MRRIRLALAFLAPLCAHAADYKCEQAKSKDMVMRLAKAKMIYEMGVVGGALNVTVN